MSTRQQILNYVKAAYPLIYAVTFEELRFREDMQAIAKIRDRRLVFWSLTSGLTEYLPGEKTAKRSMEMPDPMNMLEAINKDYAQKKGTAAIICLIDFHPFFEGTPNALIVRKLRDLMALAPGRGNTFIVCSPILAIPRELEKDCVVVEYALPDKTDVEKFIENIAASADLPKPEGDHLSQLIEATLGLTETEGSNALALSFAETGELRPSVVMREKVGAIKKTGLLDLWEGSRTFGDVGGVENLKRWMTQRQKAFTPKAIEFGLPTPKGVLLLGPPGTGKSLSAKACAATWGRPLLRLDAGKIFGGIVGESERNLRKIIQLAEAVAPVVVLLDEIEKAFAGASSGVSDGGTSARVFGSFLTWMEEKKAPVFVIATANDTSSLPPELTRKGRFDELWFIDLPKSVARQEILKIHLTSVNRDPKKFDLGAIAGVTQDYSGAELEAIVKSALYDAFDENRDITTEHILKAAEETIPLARTAEDKIKALRDWAKTRTRNASLDDDEPVAAAAGRRQF